MNASDTKPAETPAEALGKAEAALQLEADKRTREVKAEAATDTKSADDAKKPANPDG